MALHLTQLLPDLEGGPASLAQLHIPAPQPLQDPQGPIDKVCQLFS